MWQLMCPPHNPLSSLPPAPRHGLLQLTSGATAGEMSRLRVTASPDGCSETQTVEVKVRSREEEDEEGTRERAETCFLVTDILSLAAKVSADKEKRRSREVSPRDPATSTTFVRGSSGRSSWRMMPHSKRETSGSEEKTKISGVFSSLVTFLCNSYDNCANLGMWWNENG